MTSFGCHTRPACNPGSTRDVLIKKSWFWPPYSVFFLIWCEGSGAIFVDCACAVGLRGNRLTGMRGTWGVVWRCAHVPTIPFTWLRRAKAWAPTAHASNYQALLSIKLCEQCGSNSYVRVFFIPWGHVDNNDYIWAVVTSMGSHGLYARFWLVEKISAALWLVATCSSLYDYWHVFLHKWRHVSCIMMSSFIPSLSNVGGWQSWEREFVDVET